MMPNELMIEVWSDVACPWCYVGKRRLESAIAQFSERDKVRVRWRSFELDSSAPPERDPSQSYAERLSSKYGTSRAGAQEMIDRMVQTAASEGLAFDFEHIRSGNTNLLHRLLHLAHARGVQDAVKERFFRAYLCEGRAVGRAEVATELAVDAGLDADEVAGVLSSGLYADEVRADQREARQIGVDGVPFFMLSRRYAVPGAQSAEILLKALRQTWEEELAESAEKLAAEGELCGPDGC
jgi:predicted DsbA family dithiol-disulfide isomerase